MPSRFRRCRLAPYDCRMRRALKVLTAASTAMVLFGVAAGAATKAGTAADIATAVKKSTAITKVSPQIAAQLSGALNDTVAKDFPQAANPGCDTVTACVFGLKSSKRTLLLFGDSHASMWLPVLAGIATQAKVRLVVLWHAGCHVADLAVTYEPPGPIGGYDFCMTWLPQQVTAIEQLKPTSILIGERTTQVYGAGNTLFTRQQWQDGLVRTISQLVSKDTKIGIFEDLPWSNIEPGICLSQHLTQVQQCGTTNPNPANPGQQVAEQAAAIATHSLYFPTHQWFCNKALCSPIIGNYITKWDQGHVSATYARFLATVLATAVKPLL